MIFFYWGASPSERFEQYLFPFKSSLKVLKEQTGEIWLKENSQEDEPTFIDTTKIVKIKQAQVLPSVTNWPSEAPVSSPKISTKLPTNQPTTSRLRKEPNVQLPSSASASYADRPSQIIISDKTPLTPSRFPPVSMILNRTDMEIVERVREAVENGIPTQGLEALPNSRSKWTSRGQPCQRETVAYNTKNVTWETYPKFIHIPKTGGTSIENIAFSVFTPDHGTHVQWGRSTPGPVLHRAGISAEDLKTHPMEQALTGQIHPYYTCHWWHRPVEWWRSEGHEYFHKRRTFCIVRNPWSRIVSELNFVSHQKPPNCIKTAKAEGNLDGMLKKQLSNVTFHDRQIPMPLSDCHYLRQVDYVFDEDGCRVCDDIVQTEDFVRQLTILFTAYGLKPPFVFEKANTVSTCDEIKISEMKEKTKKKVTDYYKRDFVAFGYSIDPGEY